KAFFLENDIYSHKEEFEGLFEREKDNQFRNDVEQNIRWISLIKGCSTGENSNTVSFVDEEKRKLVDYLESNKIVDE
ncbi:hypothetical protein B9K03_12010, partial [Rothia sp. Olga]